MKKEMSGLNKTGKVQQMKLEKSQNLHQRALEIIPGGTNTNSKRVETFLSPKFFPTYIERGEGAYVWDLDGNRYIDYVASLAPINIGYNIKRINDKIRQQLEKGILFSLPSSSEVELAEVLIEKIPGAEMVRFLKTGAEVTSAAVRLARVVTGKDMILSCDYHGWHDWWSAKIGASGIPQCFQELITDFPFNDFETLEKLVQQHDGNVACIIMTAASYGIEPKNDFLQKVRKLADEKGILLIFDEIITGFRWALGGAQEKYDVIPDLAAFGKGMANGMPISALVGKKEYMSKITETFVTSTFASEAVSIAASLETIRILEEENVIRRLYEITDKLREGLRQISESHQIGINLFDPTPVVKFEIDLEIENSRETASIEFMKYCTENGLLIRRYGTEFSLCPMASHSDEDIEVSLEVFDKALKYAKEKSN